MGTAQLEFCSRHAECLDEQNTADVGLFVCLENINLLSV